jgi:hypothetical protein
MTTKDTVEVPIGRLVIDPDLQVRVQGLTTEHVQALEEALDALPPPTAVRRGKDVVPIDGHHTIAAFQNAGRQRIRVRIVEAPPDADLYAAAFEANARHGMALTLSDRVAFGEHLVRKDPLTPNMEVSRRAGLSPTTVQHIRERLEAGSEIERTDRRVVRGGSTYSYPGSTRKAGELPAEKVTETLGRVFSSAERRSQRKVGSFLRRVVVAMEDGIDQLSDPEIAAESVFLVLGEEEGHDLGRRLVESSSAIGEVGRVLAGE